ncbi:MAG: glucose 1-dehydrogenase [Proteobacteria bacterium]|nr:glucose 1-dehydrogenase [Pseudomonadota bacterium]
MNSGLQGRTAIVTGGSKGIGKAIAKSLALEGANVVICARALEPLISVQKEIDERGGSALAVAADVMKPEAVQKVVAATIDKFGGMDILVNNAGGAGKFGGFFELSDEDWLEAYKLNIMSAVNFVRYSVPWLKKSKHSRIINISSISGIQPGYYNPHYTVTKAAMINLTKVLSNQLLKDNILVNVVCPGPVHSYSWEKYIQDTASMHGLPVEEVRKRIEIEEASKIPLGKVGEPEEVAELVTFLASDKASWIAGSCFHVNGGKLHTMC